MARGSIVKRYSEQKNETVYYAVYRVGRRQVWKKAGYHKRDAEKVLAEINAQFNNGVYREVDKITFQDFAKRWLESMQGKIKPHTLRTYADIIRNHMSPAFSNTLLHTITTEQIDRFIGRLAKIRSAKTANNVLVQMKTMFKHARRWNFMRDNPAQDVDHCREEHEEMDFLTPEEIGLLLKHSPEPYRTLFMTAALTGMRRGELLGLQWGDIDWNSNLIYVRRAVYFRTSWEIGSDETGPRWIFTTPKTKYSIRTVVMTETLKKALEIHRINAPVNQHDLVFASPNGNPIDPDSGVKRHFNWALSFAGLRQIRFHDLRHTFASLLISQCENIKFIQSQLGHASIQTTIDRYGHLMPNVHKGVGEKLDKQVFGENRGGQQGGVPEENQSVIR